MKRIGVAGLLLWAVCAVAAQPAAGDSVKTQDDLRLELRQIRQELDSLKTARQGPEETREDEMDLLEDRLEQRLQYLESKIDAISRASAPVVLNPRTTAFINFAARADSRKVYDPADPAKEISNRPYLRTVELELSNPVDPYADAVTVISVENEAGKDFSIDAEEAYGVIKRLPILETAPLGLKLKFGKFRAPFGVDNKIHLHDLPWTTRPLIVQKFLGSEHGNFFEAGFNPTGLDFDFFLPDPVPQTTLEANLDVVRAGELALSAGQAGAQPAWIGHLGLSRDWSNEHLLVLGLSAYRENGSSSTAMYGADATYKWAPSEERESRSFVGGGEVFVGKRTTPDPAGGTASISPYGWFGYLQYQTSYWVYLGVRYDWVKAPTLPDPAATDMTIGKSVSAYVSYYTTEFLRFRLGLEHRWNDADVTTGILEINVVFGSHPTEPYWVNK